MFAAPLMFNGNGMGNSPRLAALDKLDTPLLAAGRFISFISLGISKTPELGFERRVIIVLLDFLAT